VRLAHRWPGTDRVEPGDEGEGLARQVIARSRADEVDLLVAQAAALLELLDHRDQDLDLVALELAPHRGRLREGDHRDIAHQMCSL